MKFSLIIIFHLLSICFSISQENFIVGEIEKKFIHHFFLAEKYKVLEEYDKAILEYEKCLKLNPKESSVFFEMGKIFFSQGLIEESLDFINQATSLNPNNKWYLFLLQEIFYQTSDKKNQAHTWKKLIALDSQNKIYYLELIKNYLSSDQIKLALKEIIKAKKLFENNNPELIILEAEAYLINNQYEKAIQLLNDANIKDPKNLIFLQKLSEIYVQKSEYKQALLVYDKILEFDPENSTALLTSYKIIQTQSNFEKELEIFLKIFKSDQINVDQKINVLFEIFSDNKKIEKYKDYIPQVLRQCIINYPDQVLFYVLLGDYELLHNNIVESLNNYEKAYSFGLKDKLLYEKILNINLVKQEFNKVLMYSKESIEYFPYNPIFYYYQGIAFMYLNNYESSVESFINAIEYVFDDLTLKSELHASLGDVYHRMNKGILSDEQYELALSINPNYIIVLNNYSYYLSLRGGGDNLLKAEKMIEKCISLTKESPQSSFLDTYAWVLFQLSIIEQDSNKKNEKLNSSKKIMISCFENGGESAVMYEHYGDILFELKDLDGAKKNWLISIKKDPTNENLKEKINNL
ncbi:MAG: hypothetical protein CMP68_05565 [Flavobacteriales bacterium]|nr:hypothetical protein [Flavobacteriales bacterium]